MVVNGGFETGDLTGWTPRGVSVESLAIGGEFGNYSARLPDGGF